MHLIVSGISGEVGAQFRHGLLVVVDRLVLVEVGLAYVVDVVRVEPLVGSK